MEDDGRCWKSSRVGEITHSMANNYVYRQPWNSYICRSLNDSCILCVTHQEKSFTKQNTCICLCKYMTCAGKRNLCAGSGGHSNDGIISAHCYDLRTDGSNVW